MFNIQSNQAIIPRWYQLEAIDAIYNYFLTKNGNPLIGLPGGTGKSIIPAIFIHNVMKFWPNQRFLLITSVKELIAQNAEKLIRVWPNAPLGIYSAGLDLKQSAHAVVYGGIQSMIKNPARFGHRDIIFIDEAHLVSQDESSQYLTFISTMKLINPNVKIVGMTATPFRMGQGYIIEDGLFTDFCYDMTNLKGFNRLLEEGYMLPLIPKRTNLQLDISNVSMSKGDFVASQLEHAIDMDHITLAGLKEVVEAGQNRRSWLIFSSGIAHAEHIAEKLMMFGVSCAAVHSKQKSHFNDQAIQAFKYGSLRAIVNYGKLTTGFDSPPIDLIADFRPTMSVPLHIQKYCRGTRLSPETQKENCLVLDFGKNTERLGCINDPIIPKKKGEKVGDLPVKLCDSCGAYNHISARNCCACGAAFTFQVKIVAKPGTTEILRSDAPIVEIFNVDNVVYTKKENKNGKPPYIRTAYLCGMQTFYENVFPQHTGYANKLFKNWWKQRHNTEPPQSVDEALHFVSQLRKPKTIRVWCNKQFPEVLSCEY